MKKLVAAAAIVSALSLTIGAQTNQKFAQSQKENALALMKYEWKSRTQIVKDGETKNDQLAQMSYDNNGVLQKTMIASSPEPDLPTRGLRGLIAQNKKKEFMETLNDLRALAKSYSELSPDKMQHFMTTATVTPDQNFLRIRGFDVLQNGDSMTMWVDPTSRKQRRVEISTTLDEKPVRIVSEFQDIPQSGPTYMARNHTSYGTSLTIITQNFDYTMKPAQTVTAR